MADEVSSKIATLASKVAAIQELRKSLPVMGRFKGSNIQPNLQTRCVTMEFCFTQQSDSLESLLKYRMSDDTSGYMSFGACRAENTWTYPAVQIEAPKFVLIEGVRVIKTENTSPIPWNVYMNFIPTKQYLGDSGEPCNFCISKGIMATPSVLYESGDENASNDENKEHIRSLYAIVCNDPLTMLLTPNMLDQFVVQDNSNSSTDTRYYMLAEIFKSYMSIFEVKWPTTSVNDTPFYVLSATDYAIRMQAIKEYAASINCSLMTFSSSDLATDFQELLTKISPVGQWQFPQFPTDLETTIRPKPPPGGHSFSGLTVTAKELQEAITARMYTESMVTPTSFSVLQAMRMNVSMTLAISYVASTPRPLSTSAAFVPGR